MAELFEVPELVRVAVEDEKSGVAFYSSLAKRPGKLKDLFSRLAEEEKHHQRRFETMLADLGGCEPREQYEGEYVEYLATLTSTRAFPDVAAAALAAEQCKSDEEAVSLASRFERDTLILMNEMRRLVPAKDSAIIDQLATEEQGHLVALAAARKMIM